MRKSKKIKAMVEERIKNAPKSEGKFKFHLPGSQNLSKTGVKSHKAH